MINFMRNSNGDLSILLNGEFYLVSKPLECYEQVLNALMNGSSEDEVLSLINKKKQVIEDYYGADFSIEHGELMFRGTPYWNDSLSKMVLSMINDGVNPQPLILFMEKVEDNPNKDSVSQLFQWLAHVGLAIDQTGDIVGFKYVSKTNPDSKLHKNGVFLTDNQTRTFNYNIGQIAEMPRHKVEHNPSVGCSSGLHVGTFNYAYGSNRTVVMVKVNPRDVVSVPTECNEQKLRCCRFQILQEISEDTPINDDGFINLVVNVNEEDFSVSSYDNLNDGYAWGEYEADEDEDWEDEDDYDEDWE